MLLYLLGLLCLFLDSFANNKQNLAILTNNLTGLMNNTPAAKVSPLIPKKPIIKPVKPLKPIVKPPVVMPSPELQLLKESSAMPHPFTEYQLGKCKIRLVVQDILQEPADAIVNAANSRCLGGGGIDWAISNAGGAGPTGYADGKRQRTTLHDLRFALPVLPDDVRCPERESRITRGGWLSYNFNDKLIGNHNPRSTYNYVIHAVGPKCGGVVTAIEKEQVAVTYINALSRVEAFNIRPKDPHYIEFEKIDTSDLGKNYQIRSLNFPTISTGIYGCKTVDTVDSVIESVLDYITAKTNLTINQINFVFWDPSNPSKATADYNLYKAAFAKYLKK